MRRLAIVTLALALPSVSAHAQGTITDPPATFVLGASPFDASPDGNLTGVSSTLAQDHLFETGWWYRIQGDPAEKFFPAPTTQTYLGNTATLGWTDVDGRGFDAEVVYEVVNKAGPSGYVTGRLTVANPGPGPIAIDIFHMLDFDIQPTAGNDSATVVTASDHIAITDPGGNTARYRGAGANAFLVRPFGATDLGSVLADAAVTNFDDTGLPFGPGDFTAGFQWTTVSIPAGGQQSYTVVLAVNDVGPSANLGIAVSDGSPSYYPGQTLTYTVTVTNAGPDAAPGARVTDAFPADLTNVSWTCAASAGSACASASGTGDLDTTVDLLVAGTATFTVTATASPAAAGSISNTATVAAAGAVFDPDSSDNAATDTDTRTGGSYYTVSPCRLVDTRLAAGPLGGPALSAGASRTFPLTGNCGVPVNATAISLNVTATGPTAEGFLQVLPTGGPVPTVSALNYAPGQTRANNGVYALSPGGEMDVRCGQASGTVELIIDVSGYFIE